MIGNRNSKSALIKSRVVPFLPRFWEAGLCRSVFDAAEEVVGESEGCVEEIGVMAVGEVFSDPLEGDDEAEDLENNPEISKWRRMFHIV